MIKTIKNFIIGLVASDLFLVVFAAFFIMLGSWVFLISDKAEIIAAFGLGIATMIVGSLIWLLVNLFSWIGGQIIKQWLGTVRN
jgi:hypothetical protein